MCGRFELKTKFEITKDFETNYPSDLDTNIRFKI